MVMAPQCVGRQHPHRQSGQASLLPGARQLRSGKLSDTLDGCFSPPL